MIFEQALFNYLGTAEAMGPVVEQRIYPVPPPDQEFPDCLTYRLESEQSASALPDHGPVAAVYSIACVSADPMQPAVMAAQLKAVMVGARGEFGGPGGPNVKAIRCQDVLDEFDDQVNLFIRVCKFAVTYTL